MFLKTLVLLLFDFELEHGRCAALRSFYRWALGSLGTNIALTSFNKGRPA